MLTYTPSFLPPFIPSYLTNFSNVILAAQVLKNMPIDNPETFAALEYVLPNAYLRANSMSNVFQSAESHIVHSPPKLYLDMLDLFQIMFKRKIATHDEHAQKLKSGLEKLENAAAVVLALEGVLGIIIYYYYCSVSCVPFMVNQDYLLLLFLIFCAY